MRHDPFAVMCGYQLLKGNTTYILADYIVLSTTGLQPQSVATVDLGIISPPIFCFPTIATRISYQSIKMLTTLCLHSSQLFHNPAIPIGSNGSTAKRRNRLINNRTYIQEIKEYTILERTHHVTPISILTVSDFLETVATSLA